MHRIEVLGSPIGGEDRQTKNWIDHVTSACRLSELTLAFTLSAAREGDLDNLVRPAMSGLQKAGLFRRGFTGLQSISAVKTFGSKQGLVIEAGLLPTPGDPDLEVPIPDLPAGDRWSPWKSELTTRVGKAWRTEPVDSPVFVHVEIDTPYSLVDRMKPVLDCLEPFLGRDPKGSNLYCPNDHMIQWMCFTRSKFRGRNVLRAGRLPRARD